MVATKLARQAAVAFAAQLSRTLINSFSAARTNNMWFDDDRRDVFDFGVDAKSILALGLDVSPQTHPTPLPTSHPSHQQSEPGKTVYPIDRVSAAPSTVISVDTVTPVNVSKLPLASPSAIVSTARVQSPTAVAVSSTGMGRPTLSPSGIKSPGNPTTTSMSARTFVSPTTTMTTNTAPTKKAKTNTTTTPIDARPVSPPVIVAAETDITDDVEDGTPPESIVRQLYEQLKRKRKRSRVGDEFTLPETFDECWQWMIKQGTDGFMRKFATRCELGFETTLATKTVRKRNDVVELWNLQKEAFEESSALSEQLISAVQSEKLAVEAHRQAVAQRHVDRHQQNIDEYRTAYTSAAEMATLDSVVWIAITGQIDGQNPIFTTAIVVEQATPDLRMPASVKCNKFDPMDLRLGDKAESRVLRLQVVDTIHLTRPEHRRAVDVDDASAYDETTMMAAPLVSHDEGGEMAPDGTTSSTALVNSSPHCLFRDQILTLYPPHYARQVYATHKNRVLQEPASERNTFRASVVFSPPPIGWVFVKHRGFDDQYDQDEDQPDQRTIITLLSAATIRHRALMARFPEFYLVASSVLALWKLIVDYQLDGPRA